MRGGNIKVYVQDETWVTWAAAGPATLEEVCKVTDSTLGDVSATSERRTRCSLESGVNAGTHDPTEIKFTYLPQQGPTAGDSVYALLNASKRANTKLAVAYVDGAVGTVGSEVLYWGEMYVTDLSRTDGLDSESSISATLIQASDRETGSPEYNKVTSAP